MNRKYAEVNQYFGEDPDLSYDVFFRTLHNFVGAFEHAHHQVIPPAMSSMRNAPGSDLTATALPRHVRLKK